jgi:hypothetical protein
MERHVRIITKSANHVPARLPYPFVVTPDTDDEEPPDWDKDPPPDTRIYALPALEEEVAEVPQEQAVRILVARHAQLTDPQVVAAAQRALDAHKDVTVVVHDG